MYNNVCDKGTFVDVHDCMWYKCGGQSLVIHKDPSVQIKVLSTAYDVN